MSPEQPLRHYFTQEEAAAKVGKWVQTTVDFSGVPKDSFGQVISADHAARWRSGKEEYDVAVQWNTHRQGNIQAELDHLTNRLEEIDTNENTIERFFQRDQILEEYDDLLSLDPDAPLVDWFTKSEYERFLIELPNEDEQTS